MLHSLPLQRDGLDLLHLVPVDLPEVQRVVVTQRDDSSLVREEHESSHRRVVARVLAVELDAGLAEAGDAG